MMGLLLRDSKFKANASYEKLIEQANQGLNNDDLGFVSIAKTAKGMPKK
jgi:Ca-activated chloride channel family protein